MAGCGRAQDGHGIVLACANKRQIARAVAQAVLLLVRRFVLFVGYDQADVVEWGK